MLLVNAADQETATSVAKIANPLMLHLPTPDMDSPTSLFRIHLPEAPMPDTPTTLGDLALEVRSKNAGPFWVTMKTVHA
jgi:hypothetical protein